MLSHSDWAAILLSVRVALLALVLVLIPGIGFGWLLARRTFPGKALLEALLYAPLVMPPVVTGYLLLLALGQDSPFGQLCQSLFGWRIPFTTAAAVIASAVMGLPLLVRAVRLAFELVDPKLELAARTLGASPLRVFLRVSLPLASSGLVTGLTLAFARGLGEFGATIVLAGNIEGVSRTIPLAVYAHLQRTDGESTALVLAMISIALSIGALWASERVTARARRRLEARP